MDPHARRLAKPAQAPALISSCALPLRKPSRESGFVLGPNEAGKSTLLAAIGDLLFGMRMQTPYNFRYFYGALRIGARVVSNGGAAIEFKRRKAKTHAGTLLTLGNVEAPLPDDALAPFVGGDDRMHLERMFGLEPLPLRLTRPM